MRFSFLPMLAVAVFGLVGCGDEDLFAGGLDDPTPNQLRGVFRTIVEEPGRNIEIRLRFDDDKLTGAVTCSPTTENIETLSATGEVELSTGALDEATGTFSVPTSLSMVKSSEKYICEGGLKAAEYQFKIEELKMTLTIANEPFQVIYTKIGD